MKVVFEFLVRLIFICAVSGITREISAQTRINLEAMDAVTDTRKDSLTLCTQNLKNYGGEKPIVIKGKSHEAEPSDKEVALAKRFIAAHCDIIAVQELLGATDEKAIAAIERLAGIVSAKTKRSFAYATGDGSDNGQRNAFLVANDKATIINTVTYRKLLLPKVDDNQKPRQFARAPLELQLTVKSGEGDRSPKNISILDFHFKSKSGAQGDPAALQWETYRMEMAEGLRRVFGDRYQRQMASNEPVILLGDRNSHFDTASAKILEGELTLDDFKGKARCRLSKRGSPLCQEGAQKPVTFFSVITNDPQTGSLPGTFVFNKVFSFLDEILVNPSALPMFRTLPDRDGDYDSGIISSFKDASDHALAWARLHW